MRADEQHYDQHGEGRLQQLTCSGAHFLKSNKTNKLSSIDQSKSVGHAHCYSEISFVLYGGWSVVNPDGTEAQTQALHSLGAWPLVVRSSFCLHHKNRTAVIACYDILCHL